MWVIKYMKSIEAVYTCVIIVFQFAGPNSAILRLSVAAVDLHTTPVMLNLADLGNCGGPSVSTAEP